MSNLVYKTLHFEQYNIPLLVQSYHCLFPLFHKCMKYFIFGHFKSCKQTLWSAVSFWGRHIYTLTWKFTLYTKLSLFSLCKQIIRISSLSNKFNFRLIQSISVISLNEFGEEKRFEISKQVAVKYFKSICLKKLLCHSFSCK